MTFSMAGLTAFLASKGIYFLTAVLLSLGIYGMISCKNYMKKLICMNIMQVAVIFFFLCFGQKTGARHYINPLPHGLMLTAIVVSLGTTGVGLALLTRIKEKYGSVEEEEIIRGENKFR